MSTTKAIIDSVRDALSHSRIGTYEIAAGVSTRDDPNAIALYAWNASVSAALLAPLHICEVVMRNAVGEALGAVYGPRWPWDRTFVLSLPDPRGQYSPRRDLLNVTASQPSTGKVIPELKFAFWQEMFTRRHDVRLWSIHLKRVFPSHDAAKLVTTIRREIYANLEVIRKLRNRIAHHEPIFARNLLDDFQRMVRLVEQRSPHVASWMVGNQNAVELISQSPIFRGGKLWKPTHEEIAQIAYRLWCEGGRGANRPDADWYRAEALLGILD
jgi:DUF2934 family protein